MTSGFGTVVNTGGTGLRCRMAPNTTAGIITVVPDGARLAVRGPAAGGWVPVTCANHSGWTVRIRRSRRQRQPRHRVEPRMAP
jgi:uncharacterized protein YraI